MPHPVFPAAARSGRNVARMARDPRDYHVPDRPPPGPVPGAVVGTAGGLLLALIWTYGAWDVALAVTAVLAGLVASLLAGAPAWRPFGVAVLVLAVVAGVGLAVLTRS